jgi:hypothetical protein
LIEELMEEKSPTTIIATDGSIRDDITAWGGAVWKGGKLIYEWSAGKHRRWSNGGRFDLARGKLSER